MNSSSAYIEDCVSLYVPENPEKFGYDGSGSIWGTYSSNEHIENTTDNVGALKYKIEDIQLTEKEINGSKDEERLAKKLEEKRARWISHHGASADTLKVIKNPVQKLVDGGNPDGKNEVKISGLNIRYTHIFENETAAYNKKFKMTEKELTVKVFSTPAKASFKKVKIDSKNNQVKLTWNKVKKAEGYEIYIATWKYASTGNKYGEYEREETVKSANGTEYMDKYLSKGAKYFYKIRAYRTVDGVKVYGPFSDVKEVELAGD